MVSQMQLNDDALGGKLYMQIHIYYVFLLTELGESSA